MKHSSSKSRASNPLLTEPLGSGTEAQDEASPSSSDGGKVVLDMSMWSPTLLKQEPNVVVLFYDPQNNFMIWLSVGFEVHRDDSWFDQFQTMYSLN